MKIILSYFLFYFFKLYILYMLSVYSMLKINRYIRDQGEVSALMLCLLYIFEYSIRYFCVYIFDG